MPQENRDVSTCKECANEICTTCLCMWMCGINSILLSPFKIAVDLLSTLFCFKADNTACFAMRHEIDYAEALFDANHANPYPKNQTYNTIDRTMSEKGQCSGCWAPYANTLFACYGIKEAVREKYFGRVDNGSLPLPTHGYASIQ